MAASSTFVRIQNLLSLSTTQVALNPVVTASILWALTKSPAHVREPIFSHISSLRDPRRLAQVVKALKGLLAIGLLRKANQQLNKVALNAWRWKSQSKEWVLSNEIAVVTGGCSGIGELIVKGLAEKGVRVAVLDIQHSLPATLQGYSTISFFNCDVTDPAAVNETADHIRSTLGAPSILINNAGIAGCQTILDTPVDWLRKIFDVNLLSNWWTVKAFLPDMIKRNKGHVVTVASTASYIAVAGMVDYTSTKAGVLAFHEGLNQELKLRYNAPNIITTSVHPNWVRTPLIRPYEMALHAANSPIIEPQAVADAVLKQIFNATGGQVYLPEPIKAVSLLRGLPNWLQEVFRESVSKAILRGVP